MKLKRVLRSDYVLLALIALPAMLSLLLNAGLPNTADGVLHLYRTFELDRAWREGVFYPRIAPDFAYGYGYPIFNYYAPLFYFMCQALHVAGNVPAQVPAPLGAGTLGAGNSLEWALKGAILITFYLYPLGMYLFARRWLPRAAALAAAAAYLYVPYRFYEAFIQGDYPQFLALAIVPFCLWAVSPRRGTSASLSQNDQHDAAGLSSAAHALCSRERLSFPFIVAYSALILSHNITALITTPLIGAYILFSLAHEALHTRRPAPMNLSECPPRTLGAPPARMLRERALPARRSRSPSAQSPLPGHVPRDGWVQLRETHSVPAVVRRAAWTALAIALAVGLTAFFWLPALGEQRYVHIEKLTSGGFFDFRKYFLAPAELLSPNVPPDLAGVNPYIPFNLGPMIALLAAAGFVLRIGARLRVRAGALPRMRAAAPSLGFQCFCALAVLALAALTLPLSTPLWELLPLLVLTEFPWRFVGVAAIPLALLAGCAASFFCGRYARYLTALLIALIALDSFVYLFPRTPFLVYGDPTLSDIAKFEIGSQALGTTSAAEYLPIWTQRRMYDSPLTPQLLRDAIPDHLYREALPVTVRVAAVAQTVDREAYRFQSSGPLTVRILRIYFPGWTASIDGQPVPLDLDAPNATMRVQMPAGDHLVDFRFGETVLRQAADGLSLAALVLCIGFAIWTVRKRPAPLSLAPAAGENSAPYGVAPTLAYGLSASEPKEPDVTAAAQARNPDGVPISKTYHIPVAIAAALLIAFYFAAPHLGFIRYSQLPLVVGMQHTRDDRLGGELRLLGYDLPAASVRAGDTLPLTLYWQPLRTIQNDYAVFAHLDNPLTLETVAQTLNDRPGNISTVELPLSLYVRDPHVLRVPEAVEPGLYLLRVGVLNPRTGAALPATQPDGSERTRVSLQTVRVRRAAQVSLSAVRTVDARIGAVELLGYTLDAPSRLSLYWRAPVVPAPDATIFVHLLDTANQTTATFDGPPAGGLLPLSAWERYEIVVDRRSITPAPAGQLRLAVGLYDPQTQQRLPAYAADGRKLANDEVIIESVLRNP